MATTLKYPEVYEITIKENGRIIRPIIFLKDKIYRITDGIDSYNLDHLTRQQACDVNAGFEVYYLHHFYLASSL